MARKFQAADPAGKSQYRTTFENKGVPVVPKRRRAAGRSRPRSKMRR